MNETGTTMIDDTMVVRGRVPLGIEIHIETEIERGDMAMIKIADDTAQVRLLYSDTLALECSALL